MRWEPELEQVIAWIKSVHLRGTRQRNDLAGISFDTWTIVEQGLREEWIKYLNKDLEVTLDVFSYPKGTTDFDPPPPTANIPTLLSTNAQTTSLPPRPRNTRTV